MSNHYARQIQIICGCGLREAQRLESVMRDDVLHSALDWLDERQFRAAALQAQALCRNEKDAYEASDSGVAAFFRDKQRDGEQAVRAAAGQARCP
jgi:HEAT repeat protein